MGDWGTEDALGALEPSEPEMAAQAEALRRETEATIAMLRTLHLSASTNLKSSLQLRSKLNMEQKKTEEVRTALVKTADQVGALTTQLSQEEARVARLESEVSEAGDELQTRVGEKEAEIADLQARLRDQEALMTGLKHLRGNIDAFRVGDGVLREPNAAMMLPDGCVVVADHHEGLFKFSPNTQLLAHVHSPDWKWPQGLAFDKNKERLMVTFAQRLEPEGEKFERAIAEFSLSLELIRTSPGPKQAAFDHVSKERLALGRAGELFLTLADSTGSSLYKFAAGEWFLLTGRPGAYFADVAVLAQVGPITEVLVSESKMGYIHKLAVRNFDVCDRRSIAAVEKPGAIAVDEDGRLFCQDTISGKIRIVDTLRWEGVGDVGVIDEALFAITASNGYLGAAGRESRLVRVFRYKKDALKLQGD